jgi:hypothetical protein
VLTGPCEAPATAFSDPIAAGEVWQGDALENGQILVELVEIEAHPELGLLLAGGQSGLLTYNLDAVTGGLDWLSMYPDDGYGRFERIKVLDDGYVAAANRAWHMEIINVDNPAAPETAWLIPESGLMGMLHHQGMLYVASQLGELITLEMQPGGSTQELDRIDGLASPWEMVRVQENLYVADQTLGIVVFDLTFADRPKWVATVHAASGPMDLVTDGEFLYVAVGGAGVEIFSLADLAQPESVALLPTGAAVVAVSLGDDLLWAVDHEGVFVADISDPTAPIWIGFEATQGYALHVASSGEQAWVADWTDVPSFAVNAAVRAPAARPSPGRVFLTRAGEPATLILRNDGAETLTLYGGTIDDDRVQVLVSATVAEPGESLQLELIADNDGADLAATLCLATDDPSTPILEIEVGSASWNSDVMMGAGENQVGDPAPDFVLSDLGGRSWRLSEQLGHPVVLIYFATW